jgi:hypothetical protein
MDMGTLEFKKIPKSIRDWFGLDRGPIVLVFTDIVGSTDLAIHMGDRDWVSRLIQHFKKARIYIERHGGCEVKLIGDSCMVAFRTADAALDFAIDFAGDTGDPEITIRAGIHVGDVRVIENDLYGVMVNYTSRVQHAMVGQGVALSTEAKQRIEYEHGASVRRRFDIIPLNHDPLKGFPTDQQELWQITPAVRADVGLVTCEPWDEFGNISFSDEQARLDNYAINLQNDKTAIGYIRVFASTPGEALVRANRAKKYLVETRDLDPDAIEVVGGDLRDELTVQLFIGQANWLKALANPET